MTLSSGKRGDTAEKQDDHSTFSEWFCCGGSRAVEKSAFSKDVYCLTGKKVINLLKILRITSVSTDLLTELEARKGHLMI